MSFVAVAVGVGGALIGGATQIIGGNKAAGAVKDSAAQTDATNRYIYDTARADNAPARAVGQGALYKLADMYGVPRPTAATGGVAGQYLPTQQPNTFQPYGDAQYGANEFGYEPGNYQAWREASAGMPPGRGVPYEQWAAANPTAGVANASGQPAGAETGMTAGYDGWQASPGYAFRRDEGIKAIERSAAARGSLRGGATMKSIGRYVDNTASSEYENYANRLAALAGIGQSANAANQQAGQAYAGQQTATNMAAGQARASAYQNTGNAINSGVQNLASAFLYNKGYGGGGGYGPGYGGI